MAGTKGRVYSVIEPALSDYKKKGAFYDVPVVKVV
jgi:hypothetical protein